MPVSGFVRELSESYIPDVNISINMAHKKLSVEFDTSKTPLSKIAETLDSLGYPVSLPQYEF